MKKNTLVFLISTLVIIILIGMMGVYVWMKGADSDNMTNTTDTNESANANTATSTATSTDPAPVVAEVSTGFSPNKIIPATKSAGYEQTLAAYRDRRIQFDNCTADPYRATYKNNTDIMFDNRSADPQEIRLNTRVVRLQGYEYKIVKLSSTKVPATISIDCTMLDQPAYNVGTILLQP